MTCNLNKKQLFRPRVWLWRDEDRRKLEDVLRSQKKEEEKEPKTVNADVWDKK